MIGVTGLIMAAVVGVVTAQKGKVKVGLDECITAANIMRTSKLTMGLPALKNDSGLQKEAKKLLEKSFGKNNDCSTMKPPSLGSDQTNAFGTMFDDGENPECLEGMSDLVTSFLESSPNYPPAYDTTLPPWDNPIGEAAARVFWNKATKVGCAYTSGCNGNMAICLLNSSPAKGEHPFSNDVFTALQKRYTDNIDLTKLNEKDIDYSFTASASVAGTHVLLLAALVVSSTMAFVL